VVEELFRRRLAGDDRAIDDLIAENMVNHAAGPQGREGWRQILAVLGHDLGDDLEVEHHHLIAEGEFVAHHMTVRGIHRASTMPLLAGTQPTGVEVFWTYIGSATQPRGVLRCSRRRGTSSRLEWSWLSRRSGGEVLVGSTTCQRAGTTF
jgi:lactoylglutathione lyase